MAKINEIQTCFKCDKCEVALASFALHDKTSHCMNKVTQSSEEDIFVEYNCFFCDQVFKSPDDLASHPTHCHAYEPPVPVSSFSEGGSPWEFWEKSFKI